MKIPYPDSGNKKHKIHKSCNTVKEGCIHCKKEQNILQHVCTLEKVKIQRRHYDELTDKRIFLLFQGSTVTGDPLIEHHIHGLRCMHLS
uniref:Uncharacterized protein n=1 Tax=Rhizophora mucronata TaxID=61149 RepID=A0A2P2M196_RHIMU